MIWVYWKNQKRSEDFFRSFMSCPIRVYENIQKNDNNNGIWSDYILSSSYAMVFCGNIYWISLNRVFVSRAERIKKFSNHLEVCIRRITFAPAFEREGWQLTWWWGSFSDSEDEVSLAKRISDHPGALEKKLSKFSLKSLSVRKKFLPLQPQSKR